MPFSTRTVAVVGAACVCAMLTLPYAIANASMPNAGFLSLNGSASEVRPDPHALECIKANEKGQQFWEEEATPEVRRAAERLSDFVSENSSIATGVAYCSDRRGLLLFAPNADPALRAIVLDVRYDLAEDGATVALVPVAEALEPLQQLVDTIPPEALERAGVSSIGVDIEAGGLSLTAMRPGAEHSPEMRMLLAQIDAEIPGVPVRLEDESDQPPVKFGFDRRNDAAPWYSSAEWAPSGGGLCSLGLPMTVNDAGVTMTAAHCSGASGKHPASGASVGKQYTTTWTANLDKYGDWKLLYNSSYAKRVYTGAITGTTKSQSHPIGGIRWAPLAKGDGLCTSGRTTGQICRYWVHATTLRTQIEGYWVRHLMQIRHDGTDPFNGWDSGGFRAGDSGGPCYYNNGSGKMIGAGTVSGENGDDGGTSFYCAQVSGVKAWNSAVKF